MSSSSTKEFVGLLPTKDKRPRSGFFGPGGDSPIIRDQFTITTWLCIGAVLQGLLFLPLGRLALTPALLLLVFRLADSYAMAVGWKNNVYMKDVIQKKFSAQFPSATGHYGPKASDNDVVVFIIGARLNHPMGLLAPGAKQLSAYFPQMMQDLEAHAAEFGFLGMSSWMSRDARTTKNEIMQIGYFSSVESLHRFAHSSYHREGWQWFNRITKQWPHISIFHETYHVPKGHWENIYVNSHAGGIAGTTFETTDEDGVKRYASPVVDASRGVLKTSAGRMSRSKGDEHDQYETDPYQ